MRATRTAPRNLRDEDAAYFAGHAELEVGEPEVLHRGPAWYLPGAQSLFDGLGRVDPITVTWAEERDRLGRGFFLARRLLQRAVRLPHPVLIVTDKYADNFYHWHAEVLPSLLHFLASPAAAGTDWRLLLPPTCTALGYARESLELLAPGRTLPTAMGTNYHAREFLYCRKSLPQGNPHPGLMRAVANAYTQHLPAPTRAPHRKVYARRAGAAAGKRSIVNDAGVCALLAARGYECLDFGDLGYAAQIALARETRVLVGIHGAALTNMLFMPASGTVYEFRSRPDLRNPVQCFYALANCFGHDYLYQACASALDADPDADVGNPRGHFTVDLDALARDLDRYDL